MLKKILLCTFGVLITLAAAAYVYYRVAIYVPPLISQEDRAQINLLPLPAKLELKLGEVDVSNGLQLDYNGEIQVIKDAFDRFNNRAFNASKGEFDSKKVAVLLKINCESNENYTLAKLQDEESYLLKTGNEILLSAASPVGILHGLETLLQLIQKKDGKLVIPKAEITDKPRFKWRGVMLDVSRHWMPKEVIIRTLDAMASAKMNVFHWHLSDDQGIRIESKVFPRLHEIGAKGHFYTQEEVKEILKFAADRGIRVVPEFDLPGHSKSWQIAYPELSTVNYKQEFYTNKGQLFTPALDVTKESVYTFLDAFIGEMARLFPDQYFHVGGDEVNPASWYENPSIKTFMKEKELKDGHALQAYFNKRMYELIKKHGKTMLGWNEIFHPDMADDVVIQAWNSHKALFEAVQNGGTGLLSSGLYLDLIQPAEKHYAVDPLVLAGAVNIEPDTSHWKRFDQKVTVGGTVMNSELVIFDKDPAKVYGFTGVADQRFVFTDGIIKDNKLTFSFEGPAGKMNYESSLSDGKIDGKMALGIMSLGVTGELIGSSEMPKTVLPKIEVIRPLTETEETRVLGGEACLWAEFVDGENVESRLWPRSAAIAEKLWSPKELTTDVEDLYRRLEIFGEQLTKEGSRQATNYSSKLASFIPSEGVSALKELIDYCEEIEGHGRMGGILEIDKLYLPDFKLDRLVDAILPESIPARKFNKLAANYSENKDSKSKQKIEAQLVKWASNHEKLKPYFIANPKLTDVEKLSETLSMVSLQLLEQWKSNGKKKYDFQKSIESLKSGENGVVLAITDGLSHLESL